MIMGSLIVALLPKKVLIGLGLDILEWAVSLTDNKIDDQLVARVKDAFDNKESEKKVVKKKAVKKKVVKKKAVTKKIVK